MSIIARWDGPPLNEIRTMRRWVVYLGHVPPWGVPPTCEYPEILRSVRRLLGYSVESPRHVVIEYQADRLRTIDDVEVFEAIGIAYWSRDTAISLGAEK